ncbi:hypothetical protein JCM1840_001463 [Sporobolomyces johnsonii]
MAAAFRPQATPASHSSRTLTINSTPTADPADPTASSDPSQPVAGPSDPDQVGVLRLRGRGPQGQRVQWTGETVDNEMLGRKKSKICCIYHKPKPFDESSDESDESDSSIGSADSRQARPARRRHHHHHHDECDHGAGQGGGGTTREAGGGAATELERPPTPPQPNAYERPGAAKGKGKAP